MGIGQIDERQDKTHARILEVALELIAKQLSLIHIYFTTFPEVVLSADDAYRQAGVDDPRSQVAMAEVHDCFTPTELVLMEDLGFSKRGTAWQDVLDGYFDLEGKLPVNPDGGLKSFGHPIGASGLRMMYEMWLQLDVYKRQVCALVVI